MQRLMHALLAPFGAHLARGKASYAQVADSSLARVEFGAA